MATFPGIAVAVSLNGFFCYDEVFHFSAEPGHAAPCVLVTDDALSWDLLADADDYDVVPLR